MTDNELRALLKDLESDRVERKASISDKDKICEAICAFANDMPDNQLPGVLFIGVNDKGTCAKLPISDNLLKELSDLRSNGNIHPFPNLSVQKKTFKRCDIAIIVVEPSDSPPVRYKGRTYIRVGPRRAIATQEDERRLSEKRKYKNLPYDLNEVSQAGIKDLDIGLFRNTYLPSFMPNDVLERNNRSDEERLCTLRFIKSLDSNVPTVVGVLTIGYAPNDLIPPAYVQFLRIDGKELTDPIKDQADISGPLPDMLRMLDEKLEVHITTGTDIKTGRTEIRHPDYPIVALQQIARNAVLHRTYEGTNAPVRITWFDDRIEVSNPGGPYGQVTAKNFGRRGITDYRNPHIAEVMKNLGYVQKFGMGIQLAERELEKNGNPQPKFKPEASHTLVIIKRRK